MSFKGSRVTQHRPQKESINKELAEAKREVHQLRREVSRLTKLLTREIDRVPLIEEDPEAPIQPPPNAESGLCPDCSKPFRVICIGPKTLHACTCGWRTMV